MNLDAQVKNKFNISEILKKLLLRVNKLENTSSNKNFIPLTGTEEGKPITGDLKIESYSGKKIKSYLQGEGGNAIDLTRVDEGLFLESYYGEGTDGVKSAELVVKGANVMYIPMNGAEETSIGFSGSIDHSDRTSGSVESDKLIYAQRSYVDRANSYTINETLTGGTWIDGKPIYRKVIQFTLQNGVFVSDLTNLNIEHCLKCSANLLDDNPQSINEQLWVSRGAVSQFYSRVIFPNLLEVAYMSTKITTGETSFNNVEMSGSVILEYTKTTD